MSHFFLPVIDDRLVNTRRRFPNLRLFIRRLFITAINCAILAGMTFLLTYLFLLATRLVY